MNKAAIVACVLAVAGAVQAVAYNNQKQQVESLQRQLTAANKASYTVQAEEPKALATAAPHLASSSVSVNTKAYVANSNTGKYHKASCASVKSMYDNHKVYYSTSK